ncbi:AAA family ATPase [Candidatus Poriferisodalis sp.]|uniref:AAA family ATPase n=1 Tax=Candidatus Poriferisodalis sp. TaxID=3101277 RepID=UPI003D1064E7
MRIHRITLTNYRGVDHAEVTFDECGVTVIEGDNEAGKTSLVEALELLLDERFLDRSGHRRVKSVMPVHRDADPEVEAEVSTGPYRFVFAKRWGRSRMTTLDVSAPQREQLTGDEAHERVQSILSETLDTDLLRALQVRQGAELALPSFADTDLGAALDTAAGAVGESDSHDGIWQAITAERDMYWTSTGKRKTILTDSHRSVADAEADVASLTQQLAEVEADADRAARLASDAERLQELVVQAEEACDECQQQVTAAEGVEEELSRCETELERLKTEAERAQADHQARTDLVDEEERFRQEAAELRTQAEQAAPALAAARRHHDEAEAAHRTARERFEQTQQASALADRDSEHLRQIIEARHLGARHERVVAAQEQLDAASAVIESIHLDKDDVAQIEAAQQAVIQAQAAADAGSATVATTGLSDLEVIVDGVAVHMKEGDEQITDVVDSANFVVPGSLRITVTAGNESRQLGSKLVEAEAALRGLCDEAGVADLAEARDALVRRHTASREHGQARDDIERDLDDLTVDDLASKAERLSARVAAYPNERTADVPLPPDHDTALRAALDLRDELKRRKATFESAVTLLDSAQTALHGEEVDHAALTATIVAADNAAINASQKLETARAQLPDAVLGQRVAAARETERTARSDRDAARTRLEELDIDSLRSRLSNAEQGLSRARAALSQNHEDLRTLQISLDLRGEKGLGAQLDAVCSKRDRCIASDRSLRDRAEAAKLLHQAFEHRRTEARQRYIAPFKQRIEQYGRIVYDTSFEVDVDDALAVSRRTLNGITLAVNQLSTGAQEQMGIIARLACASIVSPDGGGAPVVLDDALGWSDPSRLQGMGAAINIASGHCQVIILTCTPGRYAHVGNATVVNLPMSPRLA